MERRLGDKRCLHQEQPASLPVSLWDEQKINYLEKEVKGMVKIQAGAEGRNSC